MKKNGFTLVELLSIIVILAIIALITTPHILNIINNVKKRVAESSAIGYVDALEKGILQEELKGKIKEKTEVYVIGEMDLDFVNIKGNKPSEGWLQLEKGLIKAYSLKIGEYVINYNETTKKVETIKNNQLEPIPDEISRVIYKEYKTGTKNEVSTIYYNPIDALFCTETDYNNNPDKLGKTGCLKWYSIENSDSSKSTVDIILDHNTTATVAWNSKGSNLEKKEVQNELNKLQSESKWNVTPRLIEADEIAEITGNTTFNQNTTDLNGWFYLDSNNQNVTAKSQGASNYSWLYDYTKECESSGCNIADSSTYGYWTSTPVFDTSDSVWRMNRHGNLYSNSVNYAYNFGVRPVITVLKSSI